MNKLKKLFISIVIIFSMISIYSMNNIESNADDFTQKAKKLTEHGGAAISVTQITSNFRPLENILYSIGVGVLVAVTAYLGVQYFISPPDKQGALKEKLIGVVVSGVVIFGALKIWQTVVGMFEEL